MYLFELEFSLVNIALFRAKGLPRWLSGKESTCQCRDMGSIPGLGRSPEEGTGNPLQYSCLKNSMDRGGWQATAHGVAKSWTQLSNFYSQTDTATDSLV